ncbi:Hypothetical protein R9X50_00696700 [Acrodontium crateriforme]|uniref:Ars binding protein 2 n=1 Tax=Acrodontium crateriforme TaxID=150365 RepID=A0AAQ3MDN1_9PEZI|nr:Hypothetical protein R9X50_00696700 [Acrodontium crateriforme]
MYAPNHDSGAGAEQNHHFLSATSATSTFSTTQFPSPLFSVDPRLHGSPQHLRPQQNIPGGNAQTRQSSNDAPGSMQPPSISPQPLRATPARVSSPIRLPERALPPRNVTADSITDAFVSFILYCNPHFPLDIDTAMLKSGFEGPPKSDNKEFQTYRLFELIRKFDAKEIKTWGQLALDLGVEAPDVSKGQSVQKVQQYSVRLKRWMRAMHIDAFFEYLLGKQHVYFTEIPTADDPYPAGGRDGVPVEEDLAVRALDPSFRPKRGRRRNSETEHDDNDRPNKEAKLDQYGQPQSAFPSDNFNDPWASAASAIAPRHPAPWDTRGDVPQSAVATSVPSHQRWQLHGNSTPHPMTAHPTSMAAHIDAAFDNEPRSAVTSSARRRRKHGPSVSSAWNSTNTPGAKPRGRPPANRSIQDGPFSTFPADPSNENLSTNNNVRPNTPPETRPTSEVQPALSMAPPLIRRQSDGPGRPGRLSLQVPQHTGGPVRLATPPPPRVLLNGDPNDSDSRGGTQTPIAQMPPTIPQARQRKVRNVGNVQIVEREIPGFMFETLKRILTSDLLRAEVIGRRQRLTSDEAKRLADTILDRLSVPRQDTDDSRDDIARLTAASWLGVGEQLNVPLGPATSRGKRVVVTRFRSDAEGYEEIVSAYEDSHGSTTRDVFDISWTVALGTCTGAFEIKGVGLNDSPLDRDDHHDELLRKSLIMAQQIGLPNGGYPNVGSQTVSSQNVGLQNIDASAREAATSIREAGDGIDWKQKYLALEIGNRMAMGELKKMKERVVEKVLDSLLE